MNKVQYGLCEIGELACKQALLFEHQRSEPRENVRASGEAVRGFSRASTFHRRVFNNYSSSPNGPRGHGTERNNCFGKIQLVGQTAISRKKV